MWCIPQIDQEFEERMLDVLDVYERPYDLEKPVVCLDEKSVELRASSRPARRAKPHHLKKVDSEYVSAKHKPVPKLYKGDA